jgi:hypothetical protein
MNVLHLRQGSLSIGFEYGVEGLQRHGGLPSQAEARSRLSATDA